MVHLFTKASTGDWGPKKMNKKWKKNSNRKRKRKKRVNYQCTIEQCVLHTLRALSGAELLVKEGCLCKRFSVSIPSLHRKTTHALILLSVIDQVSISSGAHRDICSTVCFGE